MQKIGRRILKSGAQTDFLTFVRHNLLLIGTIFNTKKHVLFLALIFQY